MDGDLEAERTSRQAAAQASYERLELTALMAYSELLDKDVRDGEEVGERARSVGRRIAELEVGLVWVKGSDKPRLLTAQRILNLQKTPYISGGVRCFSVVS